MYLFYASVTMARVSLLMIRDIGQRKTGVIDIPERVASL